MIKHATKKQYTLSYVDSRSGEILHTTWLDAYSVFEAVEMAVLGGHTHFTIPPEVYRVDIVVPSPIGNWLVLAQLVDEY